MKSVLILVGAVLFSGLSFAADPPKRVITVDDFKKLLMENTWTWERSDMAAGKMEFRLDGTMRHTRFITKYAVKSINQVELRGATGKKIVLTFTPEYDGWEGVDFDGVRPISGRKIPRSEAQNSNVATPSKTQSASNLGPEAIYGKWTITSKTGYVGTRDFKPDGTVVNEVGTKALWKIEGNELNITHAGGEVHSFTLPVTAGKIPGNNNKGSSRLTLERSK